MRPRKFYKWPTGYATGPLAFHWMRQETVRRSLRKDHP
jgi:hypothetical protein